MIDIKNATHKELLEEWEICEELWGKYSCDCFGFYMNHLHTAITNKGGWIEMPDEKIKEESTLTPMGLPTGQLIYIDFKYDESKYKSKLPKMKKFKVETQHLVFFEKGNIIQFDGKEHYRVEGDTTDRKLPKDVVENCPLWFKEIKDEE